MNRVTDGQEQDPCARLSVDEVAALLKAGVGDVQEQTRRGELVAARFVLPAGGEVRYPAYQFDPRLREPVRQCLQLLGPVQTFLFLGSVHPDMSGLTPLEVLLGLATNKRALSDEAAHILCAEASERAEFVLGWANVHRDQATCC